MKSNVETDINNKTCNDCALFNSKERACGHAPEQTFWYEEEGSEFKEVDCCRFEYK